MFSIIFFFWPWLSEYNGGVDYTIPLLHCDLIHIGLVLLAILRSMCYRTSISKELP